ncbi:MAG TPA: MFS transporter [Gaiellaceae bacterium]|nr:MFS transporter [Gaiellaceae bacterium]
MGTLAERLRESGRAFRGAFANPQLRRLQLAGAGSVMGQWAYSVALAVFAYHAGGARAVGVVALVRTIPAALAAPLTSTLADRLPRVAVMAGAQFGRAATIGAAGAIAVSDGPHWAVYTLAGVASILGTAFLPAESALLPKLARTPEELTAANVARSTIDSVGSFAGPAIGGALLAATSPGVVFFVTAGTFVWGGLIVSSVTAPERREPGEGAAERESSFLRETAAGFRTIAVERGLRVVATLYAAQTMVAGAFGVLVVVTALKLLEKGESAVGYLNAAMGIGGLAGAVVAFALVGRNRLASDFGVGIVLWGAPLALIGAWPNTPVALAALAVLGLGNTLVDVAGLTLMQRTAPSDVLARVFGVLETLLVGTIGLGAILAPLLIDALGIRWALVATGAFLPALAALTWRQLLTIDAGARAPTDGLRLLERIPIFAPLPTPSLERLASQLDEVAVPAGGTVIRQGDAGDRFYVVESGRLSVTVDGVPSRELAAGDFFGEIALLRDVPRTATVVAETDARLHALGRDQFLAAVTGYAPSARAADAVVGARLGARPAETAASP